METIGFIGLGIMGRPMAKNILKAGYPVVVHNRSHPGVDELVAAGASAARSPAAVARQTDIVITMLPDSPDVELVALGADGILSAARPGQVIVDMSTIAPTVSRRIAVAAQEKGCAMLDAPVSGSDKGAAAGTLSIMVGGDDEVVARCKPLLSAMGKVVHVGPSGMGTTVKLCNQIVGMLTMMAVSEGLLMGARAGADLNRLIEAMSGGAARSWMLENLAPKIIERDFAPGFMVRLAQKDLRLALQMAAEHDLPLPGISLVHQFYRSVEASGDGDLGIQALALALERLSGTKIES
jgi:2-hydroxy-3-oxopropionate reductase